MGVLLIRDDEKEMEKESRLSPVSFAMNIS